jgi:putative flippase GtrA
MTSFPSMVLGGSIWRTRFVRFLFVGVFNALVGYVLYLVGLALGAVPGLALALATVLGAIFNYFTTGRVVFAHRGYGRLPHFLLSYGIIYLINLGLLHGLMAVGLAPRLAQLLLLPVVAVLSFMIFRSIVFRDRN